MILYDFIYFLKKENEMMKENLVRKVNYLMILLILFVRYLLILSIMLIRYLLIFLIMLIRQLLFLKKKKKTKESKNQKDRNVMK